jgi:hypothetical protein
MIRKAVVSLLAILSACTAEGGPPLRDDVPYDDDLEVAPSLEAADAGSLDDVTGDIETDMDVAVSKHALESFRTGRTRENYPSTLFLAMTKAPGSWCTGSLVAPDIILTAAHCVPQYANKEKLQLWAYKLEDGTSSRVTGLARKDAQNATANCGYIIEDKNPKTMFAQVYKNTRWSSGASYDAAVIKLLSSDEDGCSQIPRATGNHPGYVRPFLLGYAPDAECDEQGAREGKNVCFNRIMNEEPAGWFEWNGWGHTRDYEDDIGTKLNFGVTVVDWTYDQYFGRSTRESDLERSCEGDSGGPAVVLNSHWGIDGAYARRHFQIGINSHGTLDGGHCAAAGGSEKWTRVDKNMFLITNIPGRAANDDPGAGRTCTSYVINGHSYWKCWNPSDWIAD